jgi:hypothetical protein
MGFAITWCAVREENAEQFLRELGLSPTGSTEEFPESLISIVTLDTGWRVLWYNSYGCSFLEAKDLARISADKDVVLCMIEEHVMAVSSEMWSGGKRTWWLSHEGEYGPKGVSTDGDLPESFPAIRREMEQKQLAAGGDNAEVDYIFEIPLRVAKSLVGFQHDEESRHRLGSFVVLSEKEPTGPLAPQTSFFRRLFGK